MWMLNNKKCDFLAKMKMKFAKLDVNAHEEQHKITHLPKKKKNPFSSNCWTVTLCLSYLCKTNYLRAKFLLQSLFVIMLTFKEPMHLDIEDVWQLGAC